MAGDSKQEYPPLLKPGFHPYTLEHLRNLCVTSFPASMTRPGIMDKLESVVDMINHAAIPGHIWVDGSFLTQKLNPDDVDLLLHVDASDYSLMTAAQQHFVMWFNNTSLYDNYRCDNYLFLSDPNTPESEYMYAYWLRQFGFSRRNEMKGLAVLKVPFVI